MQEIQINLTLPEVNQILEALGQKPYAEVYQLVGKIQQQAEAQIGFRENNSTSQPSPPEN